MERFYRFARPRSPRRYSERGQGFLEYAIIISFIGLTCLAVVGRLGASLNSSFSNVSSALAKAGSTGIVSTTATRVYGQLGSFTTATANKGGISANSLLNPYGVATDSNGNLYIIDNNRVLYYPAGSTTATRVYGQGGSFTTETYNNGGVSANSLAEPVSAAVDSGGGLYVADWGNNRVLYYPAGSTTATRVYGQSGSFATSACNIGGRSATSLCTPGGLALDSGGNLYVGDGSNNRVLYYPAGSTTATRVYGQGGSFATGSEDNGGISANSLACDYEWCDVAVDSGGNLYVGDMNNNRVLYYPAGSTTATRVYGQLGSFTTVTPNKGGVSADSLSCGYDFCGVAVDSSGNLYVADADNYRVLYYPAGSTTATRVFGQGGSFTSATPDKGGISASSLEETYGITVDGDGNLYVADCYINRVLYYPVG